MDEANKSKKPAKRNLAAELDRAIEEVERKTRPDGNAITTALPSDPFSTSYYCEACCE